MRAPVASGLLCSGLAMLLTMSASAAETGPIETSSEPPRRVGWFLGDRLAWHGRIVAPEGFELDPASLPQPGPIDNFTEIGSIAVEDGEADGARAYDITIDYQSFYVPLEPREVSVPGLSVELRRVSPAAEAPERREASFAGWSVVLSPLRPILETSRSPSSTAGPIRSSPRRPGRGSPFFVSRSAGIAAGALHRGARRARSPAPGDGSSGPDSPRRPPMKRRWSLSIAGWTKASDIASWPMV